MILCAAAPRVLGPLAKFADESPQAGNLPDSAKPRASFALDERWLIRYAVRPNSSKGNTTMTMKFKLSILAFAGLGTMACGTYNSSKLHNVRQPAQTHLEPLTRAQVTVNDVVEGQACAKFTALWPIPIFWSELPKDPTVGGTEGSSLATMLTGNSTADRGYRVTMFARATTMARNAAKQVALGKAQNPDMVISEYYIDNATYSRP
jgi:hypothetical protein